MGKDLSSSREIIVVDNGSLDGSVEMVRNRFPSVRVIANPDNKGFAAANNQALRQVQGRYALLLNSDTVVHGDVLAAASDYMDRHEDVGVLGCRVLNGDGSLQSSCSRFPSNLNLFLLSSGLAKISILPVLGRYRMSDWQHDKARDVEAISGCFMFVRMSCLSTVGFLDETFFFFGEEVDWCLRFRQNDWAVRFVPLGEITHFGGGSTQAIGYKRELLLSKSLVQLNCKHHGFVSGSLTWLLLLLFNLTRFLFWGALAFLGRSRDAKEKCQRFRSITRHFGRAWPRKSVENA